MILQSLNTQHSLNASLSAFKELSVGQGEQKGKVQGVSEPRGENIYKTVEDVNQHSFLQKH